ncbi:MAG TPA: hypothetical protein VF075_01240, partial [Pyrinomonadaceae bacterium]
MNDDYLWDKSGKPDPQIQELEQILGSLRYEPKPFEIPRDVPLSTRRKYFPLVAIAATLLLALLVAGIWFRMRTGINVQLQQARVPETPPVEKVVAPVESKQTPEPEKNTLVTNGKHRNRSTSAVLAKREREEREEAFAAKEQLMVALRLASEKLNLAHRRAQN